MKILALEFSSSTRSVAVWANGQVRGYAEQTEGRETRALAMIESALSQAGLEREEIDSVAVGLGPGSYTGVRISIALAQGWQLARGVKLLGISSAEVVAAHAGQFGIYDPVWIGLEARPGELFVASYDASVFESPKLIVPFHRVTADEHLQFQTEWLWRMDWSAGVDLAGGVPFEPEGDFLAILAATRTDFVSGEKLEPIYLVETNFVKAPSPRIIP